jgi:CubicO group peptidase (beta-lactamase class C family)
MSGDLSRFVERIDRQRQTLDIPGLSLAVLRHGELIRATGLGMANIEKGTPADEHTPYMIASLSKTFASTILLQEVEKGRLDLDRPIADYMPDYDDFCREVDGSNEPLASGYNWRSERITVRHHFTHTAQGRPGTRYSYNTFFFKRLSTVLETVTGRSYRDLLVERIFRPADFAESAPELLDEEFGAVVARMARPYQYDAQRGLVEVAPPDYPRATASAGIVSTVLDLAKFDVSFDRGIFLRPETRDMAWMPMRTGDGRSLPYALGWFVQDAPNGRYVWHYGWHMGSFSALYLKLPAEGWTFVFLANSERASAPFGLREGDVLRSPFAVLFLDLVIGQPL